MKVAVVDSGIDIGHKRLINAKISGIGIRRLKSNIEFTDDFSDRFGHGTGIASIIYRAMPEAEIVSVKIFHESLQCDEELITASIQWCIDNEIDIINLSLGIKTASPSQRLRDICKTAISKNIIIVAASGRKYTDEFYPAFFNQIFGVTSGNIKRPDRFGYIKDFPVEFIAKGNMHRVASINNSFSLVDGSSYACAYFTGIIGKLLSKLSSDLTIPELKEKLIELSDKEVVPLNLNTKGKFDFTVLSTSYKSNIEELFIKPHLKKIKNIALFPISEKELKLFLKFPDYCIGKVTKKIDYPKAFIQKKEEEADIQDWMLNEHDLNTFDTLAVGYFHEHLFEGNVEFGKAILKKSLLKDKILFFFDAGLKERTALEYPDANIYAPVVDLNTFNLLKGYNYNQRLKTPVLAVVGTGSKQGKFTVQLRIREILKKEGYIVSHISTEPHGELLGADFSFPMGYNSTVKLNQKTWPFFLRSLNRAMEDYYKPNIILTGIQSWTISPVGFPSLTGNELRAIEFLIGCEPDYIICTISPNDTRETIKKNTDAAQLFTGAKTIFYCITPLMTELVKTPNGLLKKESLLTPKELKEKINYYSDILESPVFDIMDDERENQILNLVENAFS